MKTSQIKKIVLGAMAGGVLLGSSCLGWFPWKQSLWNAALYTGMEWAIDNDSGLTDLFEDGNVVE